MLRLRIWVPPFSAAPAFGAEAVAGDDDLARVMREPIERGGGEQRALKQIGPFGERAIRGDYERAALVPLVDHFVEIFGPGRRRWLQSEIVEDQHVGSGVGQKAALVRAVGASAMQMPEHAGGRDEDDVEATSTRFVAERLREVRFADAGRPLNQHGLVAFDEEARRQVEDLLAIDGGG